MTLTLKAAIDATQTTIDVNGSDTLRVGSYRQLEDEVLLIRSADPRTLQPGETAWQRLTVDRGIENSEPAAHAAAVEMTTYSGGAGGGAIAVTDGTTTVDPASSLSLPPGTLTDEGSGVAAYSGGFVASAVDPGAVGAGAVWKDITEGTGLNARWWERNATNDGWDPVTFVQSIEATGSTDVQVGVAAESDDGEASAQVSAKGLGDGDATASHTAFTAGSGTATAGPSASATGSGDADAGSTAQTNTGGAYNYCIARRGATMAGLSIEHTAGGVLIQLLALPTVNPGVAGGLWNDGGTLKVSAG